jgi:hypothetical protein
MIPRPRHGLILTALALATACACAPTEHSTTTTTSPPATRPCVQPASTASLGNPISGSPPAEFTTDGSPIWLTATGFSHGGFFDPKVGSTAIYIGPIDKPPTYDRQRSTISNTQYEFDLTEDQPSKVQLQPGRYWLLESNGPALTIDGCTPTAVTEAKRGGNPPVTTGATGTTTQP